MFTGWSDEQGASHFADLDLREAMGPTALRLTETPSTSSISIESFRRILRLTNDTGRYHA